VTNYEAPDKLVNRPDGVLGVLKASTTPSSLHTIEGCPTPFECLFERKPLVTLESTAATARPLTPAPFKLELPWALAGDQPKAVAGLAAGLKSGEKHQTLLGVTGSGKTVVMAAVIAELGRPTLILCHNKTLAAQLYGELREFLPGNAVEYFVSYYDYYQPEAYIPRTDTYIEKDSSRNDEIDKMRHSATRALFERRDVVIVASVSCIYGLGAPIDYGSVTIGLRVGDRQRREKVLRHLVDIQYERNDHNFTRGKFRVRGDTLEVYPAYDDVAVRVEFFGDEVERITELDPLTGEILANRQSVDVYPARHFVTPREKLLEAIRDIRAELDERSAELESAGKLVEAQRLRQRTNFDLEMLREVGTCHGVENYSRHLARRPAGSRPWTLLDYFPPDFLLFIDESHISIPQVRGMYHGDRQRKEVLVEHGFRLPSALDNRPLTFKEFEEHLDQVVYVSATPAPYELERSHQVVEQIIRPTGLLDPTIDVRRTAGQIDDLLAEIRERVARGQRTLVTTLTKKMAEDLSDYLREMGVKVHYLHSEVETLERIDILRDLRLGVYDVVVGVNLLREGLDLPEVTLVAILDADKEGYLRSGGSLVQVIGRAARHVEGHVIMYADRVTDSMRYAMEETNRRRTLQEAYNREHGIEPQTVVKAIRDINARLRAVAEELPSERARPTDMPRDELLRLVKDLEFQMKNAAKELEFERAALLRDQVVELRGILAGSAPVAPVDGSDGDRDRARRERARAARPRDVGARRYDS
jgi:excinuclease ABC subunit B